MEKRLIYGYIKIKEIVISLILFFIGSTNSYGSIILADNLIYSSTSNRMTSLVGCGFSNLQPCYDNAVLNPNNAIADNGNYARLLASPGLALGLGAYEGIIELGFDNELPANTISYVRINGDANLLQSLLGGSLGESVASAAGAVIFGEQEIEIQAKNSSGTIVLERTSTDGFDSNSYRLVVDENGNYYLRIQPDQAYQRIRIINRSGSIAGLGSEYTLDVFHTFYFDSSSGCDNIPTFTSYEGTGISLAALSLNDPISDISLAIDGDQTSTFSEMSLGILGALGASSEQLFYFNQPVSPGNEVLISLATTGSLVDLGLFNFVELVAYSNGVEVQSTSASSLLDLDVLGLLENDEFFQFPISNDTYAIDQVGVRISSLVSLGVGSDVLKISGLVEVPASPVMDGSSENHEYQICEGTEITISPQLESGQVYNWYSDWKGENLIGQSNSFVFTDDQLPGEYTYYIRTNFSFCSFESLPSTFKIIVQPSTDIASLGIAPSGEVEIDTDGKYIYREGEDAVILTPNVVTKGTNGEYAWYFDEAQTDQISSFEIRDEVSYSIDASGVLTIEGLPYTDPASPISYFVNYSADDICPANTPKELELNSILRILNISLKTFQVDKTENNEVRISWELAGFEEEIHFKIERAGEDLSWQTIYEAKDEDFEKEFFLDSHPTQGSNFYRINISNEFGEQLFISSVKAVEIERGNAQSFKVFPNRFIDELNIQFHKGVLADSEYFFYSGDGQLLLSGPLTASLFSKEIKLTDLGQFPPGRYLLVLTNSGMKETIHLIK